MPRRIVVRSHWRMLFQEGTHVLAGIRPPWEVPHYPQWQTQARWRKRARTPNPQFPGRRKSDGLLALSLTVNLILRYSVIQKEVMPETSNTALVYVGGSQPYFGTVLPSAMASISPYSMMVNNTDTSAPPTSVVPFSSPGDLITLLSGTGKLGRVPLGASTCILGTDGTDLVWVSPPYASGSGTVYNVATSGSVTGGPITSVGTLSLATQIGRSFMGVTGASYAEPTGVSVSPGQLVCTLAATVA